MNNFGTENNFILDRLNDAQRGAVTSTADNLLVLAGAGSGKTRVLVHRIAYLMQKGIDARNILAVTFTNKAAREMRERLEKILNIPLTHMWIGTFHGLAHRLLRLHWLEADLPESFQVLDADDQLRLIKNVCKQLNLDPERWPPKQSQSFINNCKEQCLRAKDVVQQNDFVYATLAKIYIAYEDVCNRSGLVDFTELLLRAYELGKRDQRLLQHYKQRFTYILIDEFQDTNALQYAWINLLAKNSAKLMVVGDDDQSIYSWRGADSANMQRFSEDYAAVEIIRLEQNYRSTANILSAANAVITNNSKRLGKKLWTKCTDGELITLYQAASEIEEARFVVDKIKQELANNIKYAEIALLYRSNAQSRILEEGLMQAGIPYRIYGGLRFFERAEIKDVLAYLRLIVLNNDDAAFIRIVNVPTRGIGDSTLQLIRNFANEKLVSLWSACELLLNDNKFTPRAAAAIVSFRQLILELQQEITKLSLAEFVSLVIKRSNLKLHFMKDIPSVYQGRLENLDELVNAASQFMTSLNMQDNKELLNIFLAHAALEIRDENPETQDAVQLMTLHAAKGLEFKIVFLCGMEEGLFPHIMSMETKAGLEEERRLCYVGMTRAMHKLYLIYATMRRIHGLSSLRNPSRFLSEIPAELINNEANNSCYCRVTATETSMYDNSNFLGKAVRHASFGEGIVINYEGSGESLLLQIEFTKYGVKWLSASYLNIL
jgi:DNA helicase II / ATP-dependent DNA helicase PcrA